MGGKKPVLQILLFKQVFFSTCQWECSSSFILALASNGSKARVSFVCNLCWADKSLLCIIRSLLLYNTLLISLQKSTLQQSKLICLFVVLTFFWYLECDFYGKTEVLTCAWGQLTSDCRLWPAQPFLGTSHHLVDGLLWNRPLVVIQFTSCHHWLAVSSFCKSRIVLECLLSPILSNVKCKASLAFFLQVHLGTP